MEDGDGLRDVSAGLAGSWPLPRGTAVERSLSRTCASFFLDAFALGAGCMVLPNLIEASRLEGTVASVELGALGLVATVTSCTIGWERLSEHVGRRPACLVAGLCRLLGLVLMAGSPSSGWLAAGVASWGAGAGGVLLSTDFVSDLLPPERRPTGLGLLLVSVALGLAAGANLGALLPGDEPRLALWICSLLSMPGFAYAWRFLPRSPRRERRGTEIRAGEALWPSEAPGRVRG